MTSDGCLDDGTRISISYQSVNTFRVWIEEVLSADSIEREDSTRFVANVIEIPPRGSGFDRFRCVGTVISQRHLLTTASCVVLPENTQMTIGVQAFWEGSGWNTVAAQSVFIHPDFNANNARTANVAVILVSQHFFVFCNIFQSYFFTGWFTFQPDRSKNSWCPPNKQCN